MLEYALAIGEFVGYTTLPTDVKTSFPATER